LSQWTERNPDFNKTRGENPFSKASYISHLSFTHLRSDLLPESARKLLEGKNFVFLATVNPNGTPQVTPTWVDTDGKFVFVNTAIGRVKQKNTKRNPEVALAITEQTNPYNFIQIRGKVVDQITGPIADEHIDKMAKKYRDLDKYPNRRPGEKRVILKIEPTKVSGWG